MDLPDSLLHKMDLFKSSGRVVTYETGAFKTPSWLAVYYGHIGAMAAAYFAKNLPSSDYEITYFEDRQKSVSDILHSSLHADSRNFIRDLKYPEARFVSQTDAVFSLGEKNNGIGLKTDYINTYSPYGLSLEGIDFLSIMQRMGGEKSLKGWENYNLAASMIRHGKFNPPDSKGRPIISDYSYGYQVDTELFHNLLRDIALDEAVTLRDLKDIKRCYFNKNQHGAIEFQSGETITPDFIIDASSHGLFIESDDQWQSSNNVVENGLETQITLQSKTLTLSINDQGDGQGYKLGRLREPWVNNVVHLGGAYGLLPIMGAPLRINQIAIERLLTLFPAQAMTCFFKTTGCLCF